MQHDLGLIQAANDIASINLGYELADDEIIVDSFAGGGGVSTGIELALGRSPDVAINHDPIALGLHRKNHPETVHYVNSVYAVNPDDAVPAGKKVGLFWASPDCKHFSNAKGGAPRSKSVRDLAWVVVHWAERQRPRVIILENVREFLGWGPLDERGKPIKARAGETFEEWAGKLRRLGYKIEHKILVAADYGAPTTRTRLFIVARRDGLPIRWPEPTHGRPDDPEVMAGRKLPWRTAGEIIDYDLPVHSIFLTAEEGKAVGAKRPLAESTMRRIAKGMFRHVIENPEPYLIHYYGEKEGEGFRGQGVTHPLATQTTCNRFGLVVPLTHQGDNRVYGLRTALPTVTCAHRSEMAFVSPTLIQTGYGERDGQSPRVPGLDKPVGTIVSCGVKHAVVAAHLTTFNENSVGITPDQPIGTVMAGATRHAYVETAIEGAVDRSCQVADFLWAHRDLAEGKVERDGIGTIRIDGRQLRISDIGLRMLVARELFRAQSFGDDYEIDETFDGKPLTKTEQTRLAGNAVPPMMAAAVIGANFIPTREMKEAA